MNKMLSSNLGSLSTNGLITKLGLNGNSVISKITGNKTVLYIFIVLLLMLVGYYIYTQYSSSRAGFTANRENDTLNENSNKTANLLLFTVDWCPHCKTAKPEWEGLKTEYEGKMINGYSIIFTEHNCTTETPEIEQLIKQYKIEGYPTIKLIKDNQVIEYDAKPTKDTMSQFLNTVL